MWKPERNGSTDPVTPCSRSRCSTIADAGLLAADDRLVGAVVVREDDVRQARRVPRRRCRRRSRAPRRPGRAPRDRRRRNGWSRRTPRTGRRRRRSARSTRRCCARRRRRGRWPARAARSPAGARRPPVPDRGGRVRPPTVLRTGGSPKCAATSSTRGSKTSSRPGKRNATEVPLRPDPLVQQRVRCSTRGRCGPRQGLPCSTTLRASASRLASGATSASRTGPPAGGAPASSRASSASSGASSWAAIAARSAPASSSTASRPASGSPVRRVRRVRLVGRSESTTCALMPPKPKALTAATPQVASLPLGAAPTGVNRVPARAGCGSSQCSVGGS